MYIFHNLWCGIIIVLSFFLGPFLLGKRTISFLLTKKKIKKTADESRIIRPINTESDQDWNLFSRNALCYTSWKLGQSFLISLSLIKLYRGVQEFLLGRYEVYWNHYFLLRHKFQVKVGSECFRFINVEGRLVRCSAFTDALYYLYGMYIIG